MWHIFMKYFLTLCIILILECIFLKPLFALDTRYSPFAPGKSPPMCKLEKLSTKDAPSFSEIINSDKPILQSYPSAQHTIEITYAEKITVRLRDISSGKALLGPLTLKGLAIGFDSVESLDINSDNKPDYVVTLKSGGNGFAAGNAWRTVLLSNGNTYGAIEVETYDPSREDYLSFDHGRSCMLVQTAYVTTDKTRDQKSHTFWVYSLVQFKNADFRYANKKAHGFPKWILYAFKPTHTETTLISDAQKQTAWQTREFGDITELSSASPN
jgi:hypothetical protein